MEQEAYFSDDEGRLSTLETETGRVTLTQEGVFEMRESGGLTAIRLGKIESVEKSHTASRKTRDLMGVIMFGSVSLMFFLFGSPFFMSNSSLRVFYLFMGGLLGAFTLYAAYDFTTDETSDWVCTIQSAGKTIRFKTDDENELNTLVAKVMAHTD